MQCIIMENTLIKLTLHDETKKRAHDSQIVRAKENLKLSHGGTWFYRTTRIILNMHQTENVWGCESRQYKKVRKRAKIRKQSIQSSTAPDPGY